MHLILFSLKRLNTSVRLLYNQGQTETKLGLALHNAFLSGDLRECKMHCVCMMLKGDQQHFKGFTHTNEDVPSETYR